MFPSIENKPKKRNINSEMNARELIKTKGLQ